MRRAVVGLLVATHLALGTALQVPGPYVVDDAVYFLQARALARGEGWTIDNGWEQVPTETLGTIGAGGHVSPARGRLVAQYPPGLAVLAAPLLPTLGYRALFLPNLLGMLLATWATARLGARLSPDPRAPGVAAGVLVLATCAWPYGVSVWPHALALGLVAAATLLAVEVAERPSGGSGRVLAAGLLLGLATTARLDAFFALGGLALGLLLAAPRRIERPALLVAGALPLLGLLSLANQARFGTWSPFEYGRDEADQLTRFLPALAGVAGLGAWAALAWLPPRLRRPVQVALLAVGVVGALALPAGRDALQRVVQGAWALAVDLRELPARTSMGLVRLTSGTVTYYGFVKKALLQSVPALVLLAFALPRAQLRRALVPVTLAGVLLLAFAYKAWHGGPSMSMRYLLPALPPAVAGVAAALCREVPAGQERAAARSLGAGAAAVGALFAAFVLPDWRSAGAVAPWLMNTPLVLAALALVLGLPRFDGRRGWRRAAWGAALAWGGLVAWGYDLPAERLHRAELLDLAAQTAALAPPDAAVFVAHIEAGIGLYTRDDLVVGFPTNDAGASLRSTIDGVLALGRPVLCVFTAPMWADLAGAGVFEGLTLRPVGQVQQMQAVAVSVP